MLQSSEKLPCLPVEKGAPYFSFGEQQNKTHLIVFDFVFTMWATHLVGTEPKVCRGP